MKKLIVFFAAAMVMSAGAASAQSAYDKFIKTGSEMFAKRADIAQVAAAIGEWEKALMLDPNRDAAYWLISRGYYYIGVEKGSTDEQMKVFEKGIDIGKRCLLVAKNSVPCHFWLGVSYGKYGEAKGVLQSLYLIDPIKQEMEFVAKADPYFEDGGAYRVLGRLHYKLPALKGGDMDKSEKYLRMAIEKSQEMLAKRKEKRKADGKADWEQDGDHLMNHVFLAETLLKLGKKDEARKELQYVVDAPLHALKRPEMRDEKKKAGDLLKGL